MVETSKRVLKQIMQMKTPQITVSEIDDDTRNPQRNGKCVQTDGK